jgi:hypothetical protein
MLDFGVSIFLPGPFGVPLKTKFQVQGWASTPGQEALVSQVRISQGGVTLSKKHLEYQHGDRFIEPAPGGFMGRDGLQAEAEENIPGWLDDFFDVYNGLTIEIKDPLFFNFVPVISSLDLAVPDNELFYFNINMDGHKKENLVLNSITPFNEIYAQPENTIHVTDVREVRDPWSDIFDIEIMVEDLRLQNRSISKPLDFEARKQIITGRDVQDTAWHKLIEPGDFVVKKNATVTLTAGNSIIFEEGTIVEDGGTLIANLLGSSEVVSCLENGAPLPATYGEIKIEGPDPYCSGQGDRIYSASITGTLAQTFTTRWALDNQPLAVGISYNSFMLPTELTPGSHSLQCEVSVVDETGQPIERAVVSLVFMVPQPEDEVCLQSQQMLIGNVSSQISMNPNPSLGLTTIKINNETEGKVSLQLLTLDGQVIKEIFMDEFLETGVYQHHLNTSGLKTGIYLISLETTRGKEVRRLEVIN